MTTTKTALKITIPMSERAPLKIDAATWPCIAEATAHDGKVECQANTEWVIRVREHADDCRRIVYGSKEAGLGGQYAGFRPSRGGYLIEAASVQGNGPNAGKRYPDNEETVRAIRRVAGIIGDDGLGDECIAELPAEELV